MANFWKDVRYSIRTLLRAPGFAAVAILTIALGIGANTAIFSLVRAVILKPLPFRDPSRLIAAWDGYQAEIGRIGVSPTEMKAWSEQTDLFDDTAWYRSVTRDFSLTAQGLEAVSVHATFVSPRFFALLGVAPAIGSSLDTSSPNNAAISQSLWRTRFASDPLIVGRTIQLDGQSFVVNGVMPENFQFPDFAELWLAPGPLLGDTATNPVRHGLGFIARMRAGISEQQAITRLESISRRLAAEHPKTSMGWRSYAIGLQDDLTAKTRTPLLMLMGAVALVLLIACANVANLLLARASSRTKEIAVRAALGAGAGRIVRQLLTESLVLSIAGGLLGIAIGRASLDLLSPIAAPLDWQVLAFLLAVSIVAGVLFGLAPALHALHQDSNTLIKSGAARSGGASKVRAALVIAEFALALMLVAGAAILLKSFAHLINLNPGFTTKGLLTMRLSGPRVQDPPKFQHELEDALLRIPGVDAVATTSALPLTTGRGVTSRFNVPGDRLINPDSYPFAEIRFVTPNYHDVMHIPLRAGRLFDDRDITRDSIIVNEDFVKRFFAGRDPIGQKIATDVWSVPQGMSTIVGVVGNVKQLGLDARATYDIYYPGYFPSSVILHTSGDPRLIAQSARAAIQAAHPEIPVSELRTMQEVFDASASSRRWTMTLLASFAGLALVLALVGIYGVMSWTVAQRTREIGVRMALGAESRQVLGNIIGYGCKLSVIGMFIGLVGTFALRRVLATLVYETSAADPLIYSAVAALMLAVAVAACYFPARRASRVDPLIALRCD